jgi:hypothetical protein
VRFRRRHGEPPSVSNLRESRAGLILVHRSNNRRRWENVMHRQNRHSSHRCCHLGGSAAGILAVLLSNETIPSLPLVESRTCNVLRAHPPTILPTDR